MERKEADPIITKNFLGRKEEREDITRGQDATAACHANSNRWKDEKKTAENGRIIDTFVGKLFCFFCLVVRQAGSRERMGKIGETTTHLFRYFSPPLEGKQLAYLRHIPASEEIIRAPGPRVK